MVLKKNCHVINVYLDKRRRNYSLFYILSDRDLILSYTQKESLSITEKKWLKNYFLGLKI